MTDDRPFAACDGHDLPGLIDEDIPGVTAVVDDVGEGFEDPVGQKNKLTYRWARKGSRPRATHDQRTQSTYLFGAVCPELGTGAGSCR